MENLTAADHMDEDLCCDGQCNCCCCTGECLVRDGLEDALSLGMVEGDYD